jgi:hypothetical protein
MGFRVDGTDHVTYNHYDSYPDSLGVTMVEFVRTYRANNGADFIQKMRSEVQHLIPVDTDKKPDDTAKTFLKLAGMVDLSVGNQSTDDWYCLLRGTQGDPLKMLEARYYSPSNGFLKDSLFCEYAYIVNLDDETMEFYIGFNLAGQKFKNPGRYWSSEASEDSEKYGAIVLRKTFPLADMAESDVAATIREMAKAEKQHSETKQRYEKRQKAKVA